MRTQVRCLTDPVYRTPVYVSFSNREQSSYREVLSSRHTFFSFFKRGAYARTSLGLIVFHFPLFSKRSEAELLKKKKLLFEILFHEMIHQLIMKDRNL